MVIREDVAIDKSSEKEMPKMPEVLKVWGLRVTKSKGQRVEDRITKVLNDPNGLNGPNDPNGPNDLNDLNEPVTEVPGMN
ncbi:MAG: hypothetical protein V3W19_11600 [Desulfatiglandales bacterium]